MPLGNLTWLKLEYTVSLGVCDIFLGLITGIACDMLSDIFFYFKSREEKNPWF